MKDDASEYLKEKKQFFEKKLVFIACLHFYFRSMMNKKRKRVSNYIQKEVFYEKI